MKETPVADTNKRPSVGAKRRALVVTYQQGGQSVSLRYTVQENFCLTVPQVVSTALSADKPPVITIEVDEVTS